MTTDVDPFDPDGLRLSADAVGEPKPRKRLPRHKKGEPFIWGPLPFAWFTAASNQPGRALAVGLLLWWQAGIKKSSTVLWRPSAAESWGLNYQAAYRGLAALEAAGLVSVERHPGRCPIVTILEVIPQKETDR
jgi:hypothetical protein